MPIKRLLIDADYAVHSTAHAFQTKMSLVVDAHSESIIDEGTSKDMKSAYEDELAGEEFYLSEYIEPGDYHDCMSRVVETVNGYIKGFDGLSAYVCLAPEGDTFRHELYEDYKVKRKGKRPLYYQACRDELANHFPCIWWDKYEADDICGMLQCSSFQGEDLTEDNANTCIVSIDKDLLSVPGWNYNPQKNEMTFVSSEEADHFFHIQWLTGDTTDDIPGIHGVGPGKAEKILAKHDDPWQCIYNAYYEDWLKANDLNKNKLTKDVEETAHKEVVERALLVADLVFILRGPMKFSDNPTTERFRNLEYTG